MNPRISLALLLEHQHQVGEARAVVAGSEPEAMQTAAAVPSPALAVPEAHVPDGTRAG